MFDEALSLPMHALVVHAAVVFIPLLALVALAYAVVPRVRGKVGWAAVGLAVLAPIAAVVTRYSGEALLERLGMPLAGRIGDHAEYGAYTMWATLALGVLTLGRVWAERRGAPWLRWLLSGLVVAASLAATVLVVLTGDSGARSVWEGIWQSTS